MSHKGTRANNRYFSKPIIDASVVAVDKKGREYAYASVQFVRTMYIRTKFHSSYLLWQCTCQMYPLKVVLVHITSINCN